MPADKILCSLWVDHVPTDWDVTTACGSQPLDDLTALIVAIDDGSTICEIPAANIYELTAYCTIHVIDNARILIVAPESQVIICSLRILHKDQPTQGEIIDQCGPPAWDGLISGAFVLRLTGTIIDYAPVSICPLPPLTDAQARADLFTTNDYYFLAGRLLWWGLVSPNCDGYSGINSLNGSATACGLTSARAIMIEWQNALNEQIRAAAIRHFVPPALLKNLIARESQFWPLWTGIDGEVGLIQLTDAGADTVLRYSPDTYAMICPRAIFPELCYARPYDSIGSVNQAAIRTALLAELWIGNTTPVDGLKKAGQDLDLYTMALAAYYCYSGPSPSWDRALELWNSDYR